MKSSASRRCFVGRRGLRLLYGGEADGLPDVRDAATICGEPNHVLDRSPGR